MTVNKVIKNNNFDCFEKDIQKIKKDIAELKDYFKNKHYLVSVNNKKGDAFKNVTITKADIGLEKVDNTSDINKPVSKATQIELNKKQNILISGISIKTINGVSLLGSGNLEIGGVNLVGTFGDPLVEYGV